MVFASIDFPPFSYCGCLFIPATILPQRNGSRLSIVTWRPASGAAAGARQSAVGQCLECSIAETLAPLLDLVSSEIQSR